MSSNLQNSVFHDVNLVRYRLAKSYSNDSSFNWLFLPGGPGADSSCFQNLIEQLDVPGKFWLIDFPGNGDNMPHGNEATYDFNSWQDLLIPAIKQFENPILVGHSFGGMLPLLLPELENILSGFIILNAAPKLWLSEAQDLLKTHNIVTFSEPGKRFRGNPTLEAFRAALLANAHCHFPANSIEAGRKMFEQLPFNYQAMLWWLEKAPAINFDATWIPQSVPTLVMSGSHDYIVPSIMFEQDPRFHRGNIEINTIPNAGHFVWFDNMALVKKTFNSFIRTK